MNKIKIYVLLACLWAVSALQAQNFGSEAMRKLQMAEFAISHFYVDKVDEDKLVRFRSASVRYIPIAFSP